ncbi:MAG: TolC family protein [Acidobacteriales bacterium]|nr:TolC family protein [Terriglobales bacterium]
MKLIRIFIILASVLFQAAAAEGEKAALTLPEAVEIAVKRYPDVEKARAAEDQLKGKIREVRAQAMPEINLTSFATRLRDPSLLNASGLDKFPEELRRELVPVGVNLFDYGVSVKQPLYTAGKVGTALRLAKIEAEGSSVDVSRAEQDLSISVVRAFYALLWAERNLEVVTGTLEQKKAHAEMARIRFKNGVATEVDALRSEVQVANSQAEVVQANNAVRQARALLNHYLLRPIDFPTKALGEFVEKPPESTDVAALAKEAERRRPELMRLRIAERSAEAQLQLARAESRLKLDLAGGYGVTSRLPENLFNRDFVRWNVGVNMTLPVFDGFKRSGMVWQATAYQRQARLEREKVEQRVRLDLRQALDDLAAAKETVIAARANVQQAEKVLSMMQNNYKYGAATTLDIVDAQTALAVARSNLLRGLHDHSVARATMRHAMGLTPWE